MVKLTNSQIDFVLDNLKMMSVSDDSLLSALKLKLSSPPVTKTDNKNATKVKCAGLTKAKKQCSKQPRKGSEFCSLHDKNPVPETTKVAKPKPVVSDEQKKQELEALFGEPLSSGEDEDREAEEEVISFEDSDRD